MGTLRTIQKGKPSGQVSYKISTILIDSPAIHISEDIFNLIGVDYMHAGTCNTNRRTCGFFFLPRSHMLPVPE